ncbi:MAG: hypothetical protein J6V14_07480 [Clostridia bacterium]|nr:hypothetical protein [Clostridia bacterium]
MNDADIAKMIKQMPADMVAESAEFGRAAAPVQSKKRGGSFRLRPALSVAVTVLLFAAGTAAAMILVFRNNKHKNAQTEEGKPVESVVALTTPTPGNDYTAQPSATVYATPEPPSATTEPPTATPEPPSETPLPPEKDPANAQIIDLNPEIARGNTGFGDLRVNDVDISGFYAKWQEYDFGTAEADALALLELSRTHYNDGIVWWGDVSSSEVNGFAQVLRCEFLQKAEEFLPDGSTRFPLTVLYVNENVVRPAEYTDMITNIVRFDGGNAFNTDGTGGLLAIVISLSETGYDYYICVFDPSEKLMRSVCPVTFTYDDMNVLALMNCGTDAYVLNRVTGLGGKAEFDGTKLTIGGVDPDAFFIAIFNRNDPTPTPVTSTETPATATAVPTNTAVPPAATPTPGTDKTAAPGATPVPSEDPSNVMTLADRMSLITVSQDGSGSITGLSFSKGYYMFDGNTMKYVDMSSTAEYLASEAMRMLTASYKKGTLPSITAEKDFYILLTNDSELVSIDVWAVNGAANADNVVPELIARGLSEAEFRAFIASGSMQFRLDPDTGETLPCFAVMTAKKNCTYFDVIGEYEYFLKTTIVPFSTSVPQSSETIRLLRYNWDGSGVGIKEISQCELNDSIVRLLKNAKLTNQKFEKISDEVVNEFSDDLPVAPGTMWVETSFGIYRISPDLKVLCKVSSHLGEGQVLEMPVMLTTALHQAWDYYPYDYYTVEYNVKAGVSTLNHVFDAGSEIELERVLVYSDSGTLHSGKALVSVTSNIDQTVTVVLECMRSEDFLGKGDTKTVSLRAGTWEDIELEFEGWDDAQFYIYLTFENKRIEVKVIP